MIFIIWFCCDKVILWKFGRLMVFFGIFYVSMFCVWFLNIGKFESGWKNIFVFIFLVVKVVCRYLWVMCVFGLNIIVGI